MVFPLLVLDLALLGLFLQEAGGRLRREWIVSLFSRRVLKEKEIFETQKVPPLEEASAQ